MSRKKKVQQQVVQSGTSTRKGWVLEALIHLICIALIFVLPEVLMALSHMNGRGIHGDVYVKAVSYVGVFYINYYLVIDRTLGKWKGAVKFLLVNVLLLAVVLTMLYLTWKTLGPASKPMLPVELRGLGPDPDHGHAGAGFQPPAMSVAAFLVRDAVVLVLTVALSVSIKLMSNWMKFEQRKREIDSKQKEMELRLLKTQLNPHFLFNALNSIYALVDINPDNARSAIHKLSKMLRYMLYENPKTVTLGSELDYMGCYISLMRMRMPASVPLNVKLDGGDCVNLPMAPILFVNIVENVFKHCSVSGDDNGIDIDITASDGVVRCHTSNACDADTGYGKLSSGVGLTNLRRRLDLQYPGRYKLDIIRGQRFEVMLEIDISTPPDISTVLVQKQGGN